MVLARQRHGHYWDQGLVWAPYLHVQRVQVGENLHPGQRVRVISNCFSKAFLEVNPRDLDEIWSGLGTGLEALLLTMRSKIWGW